jgi:hypothetical protein
MIDRVQNLLKDREQTDWVPFASLYNHVKSAVMLPTKTGHLSSVRSGPPKQEATWAGNRV